MTDEGKSMLVSGVIATIITPTSMLMTPLPNWPTFELTLLAILIWGCCFMVSHLTLDL